MTNNFRRGRDEIEHVEECPECGVALLGMSPEEFREKHLNVCSPGGLAGLIVFPSKKASE